MKLTVTLEVEVDEEANFLACDQHPEDSVAETLRQLIYDLDDVKILDLEVQLDD